MITVIDYGAGNLASVKNAFDYLRVPVEITADPERIAAGDKLLLPGVGAFGPAMERLKTHGLEEAIRTKVASGSPLLGICLGMQLLFAISDENGLNEGFGFIPGTVKKFKPGVKIPQIGWNSLGFKRRTPIIDGVTDGGYAYFVHSYYCTPDDENDVVAEADYGGPFAAVVERGCVIGIQFHPEKSQNVGLRMLKNFGAM